MAVDWIIPLGTGSKAGNDEIRLLLRSIERHAKNLNRVIVVGDALPDWLGNVELVSRGDPMPANKDANIIDKVSYAVRSLKIPSFIFSADDNILLKDCDLEEIPVLCTGRTQADFLPTIKDNKMDWNKWKQRVFHTFWLADELGVPMKNDFESHAPQLYKDSEAILNGLSGIRYHSGLGYSICSLFRIIEGKRDGVPVKGIPHRELKITWEKADHFDTPKPNYVFGGYNDDAFLNGLRDWLFAIYPTPSRFELDGGLSK